LRSTKNKTSTSITVQAAHTPAMTAAEMSAADVLPSLPIIAIEPAGAKNGPLMLVKDVTGIAVAAMVVTAVAVVVAMRVVVAVGAVVGGVVDVDGDGVGTPVGIGVGGGATLPYT